MPKRDLTISLDEFLRYLITKWKIIAIFIIVFALAFGASAKLLGEKIVIEPSEEYLKLKEEEASIKGYIENAPLMQIDATQVQEIVLYLSDISEGEKLRDYINSGAVWTSFGDDTIFYSYYDLVMWHEGKDFSLAEIKIQHYDENQCKVMAEFLKNKIQELDKAVEINMGTKYVTTDESIADVQIWYKNRMNAIEGQLEYARAGYVVEVEIPVAIIVGVLMGGLTSVIVLLFVFVIRKENEMIF